MNAWFDSLEYVRKLENAGMERQQAEVQAEALNDALSSYDRANKDQAATKGDLRETELRLQNQIREVELRLQREIEQLRTESQKNKYDLLKWQIGGWITLAAIMAKGFHWLGF